MELQRGERQTQRTKEALEKAFLQLLREKNYAEITVHDITGRANIGRSTFYRYFQSKADVLLSLHESIFDRLSLGLVSASDWLAHEPPPSLVAFLQQYQPNGNGRLSFSYQLGHDMDYVLQRMDELLTRQFEASLQRSFAEEDSHIPFSILAQSIASVYSWLIRSWFTEPRPFTAAELAGYIHRLTRAAIREAFAGQEGIHHP